MNRVTHFHLERHTDESGMSGIGTVAEGIRLHTGMCVLWWLVGDTPSIGVYSGIDDVIHLHGHGDKQTTTVIWDH